MPADDRQIAQIIARLRELEEQVAELRLRDAEPSSWIRADVVELRFFKLLEDVIGSGTVEVYAEDSDDTGASLDGHTQVTSWLGVIDGAKLGYVALFGYMDGKWEFIQGAGCLVKCPTDGTITVGVPPDGTVDEEYAGHTVDYSGLNAGVAITDLPPGLTDAGGGEISGTPTTEGEYFVTITGAAPKTGVGATGDCTITRMVRIVVGPAPEEP